MTCRKDLLTVMLAIVLLVQAVSGTYDLVDVVGVTGSDPGYLMGPRGVVVDGEGTIFVADTENHRVQVFSPDGRLIRSWGSQGTSPTQFVQPIPITIGPDNNLYIGDRGNHRVVVYSKTGTYVREMKTTGMDPFGIAVAPDGEIFVASSNQNLIYLFSPGGTLLDAFGGPGREEGKLSEPTGCVFGSDGLLYILEIGTQRVQRMDQYGTFRGTFISTHLWKPMGCAFDAAGNFYVADEGTFIAKFGPDGQFIEDWNGRCEQTISGAAKPTGISVDGAGRVFVTDATSGWVAIWQRADLVTPAPTQAPGGPAYQYVRTIDHASSGWYFDEPSDVTVSEAGTIYIANTGYGEIVALSSDGKRQNSWLCDQIDDPYEIALDSSGRIYALGTCPGPNDRIERYEEDGTDLGGWATVYDPSGFTVDGSGQVWVAEPYYHRVSVYDATGGLIRRFQQPGSTDPLIWNPTAVAIEPGGAIVVIDSGDLADTRGGPTPFHRVKRFSGTGTPITAWSANGSGSGLGSRAQDVARDPLGRFVVADTGNDRIQVFSAQGTLLAQWGTTGSGNGQFREPRGVGVDASGRVYVADTGNDRVQVFAPPTVTVVTVPGGTGLPTDTNHDGLFDDVNGNERKDFADVVLYFNQMTWIGENEPVTAFDFNGNGRIDFADVVALFNGL
ncbi:MAG: 6-bladed beta-propeller [Methanoregulaceae archaeon]